MDIELNKKSASKINIFQRGQILEERLGLINQTTFNFSSESLTKDQLSN